MKLLLIDNNPDCRHHLEKVLFGCKIESALTSEEAFRKLQDFEFDLILIETELPDGSGFSLLEKIRSTFEKRSRNKVIVFSKLSDLSLRRRAFALGAIDFIPKTTEPSELSARILSRINVDSQIQTGLEDPVTINFGSLEVHSNYMGRKEVVPLTATEFKIFHFLYLRKGQIIDRETIRTEVWKSGSPPSFRVVDKHIATLRKRLHLIAPLKIKTIHRFGYGLFLDAGV